MESLSIILTIGGFIATVVLGYLGVKYTLKSKNKTEIIFLNNSSVSLFKTFVKNLDGMEINFHGKKIDENLILFKGTFFNSGNVDIEKSIIHKPLEIELTSNFNWVKHKIIDTSKGLEVNSAVEQKKLIFEWDLLKEGEFFTFDSLVEYKSLPFDMGSNEESSKNEDEVEYELVDNMKITSRITALKNIKKMTFMPMPMDWTFVILISLTFCVTSVSCFFDSFGSYLFPKYEVLSEIISDSSKHLVKYKAENENSIIIMDDNNNIIKKISKNEIPSMVYGNLQIKKIEVSNWYYTTNLILFVCFCLSLFVFLIYVYKQRKFYNKLKGIVIKNSDLISVNKTL